MPDPTREPVADARPVTCYVIVDPDWYAKTGGPSEDEEDMLDLAFGLTETSRLGCQIAMSAELDGLKLTVPEDF